MMSCFWESLWWDNIKKTFRPEMEWSRHSERVVREHGASTILIFQKIWRSRIQSVRVVHHHFLTILKSKLQAGCKDIEINLQFFFCRENNREWDDSQSFLGIWSELSRKRVTAPFSTDLSILVSQKKTVFTFFMQKLQKYRACFQSLVVGRAR